VNGNGTRTTSPKSSLEAIVISVTSGRKPHHRRCPRRAQARFASSGCGEHKPLFILTAAEKVYKVLDLGQPLRATAFERIRQGAVSMFA
jgi:hypothetical protein